MSRKVRKVTVTHQIFWGVNLQVDSKIVRKCSSVKYVSASK